MSTALILGASGTVGGAIAAELIARGWETGLHYHTHREPCEKLAAQAAAKNLRAICHGADFNDAAAPGALAAAFLKDFSRVDALIWAAGISRDSLLASLDVNELRAVMNVDLKAFFLMLKAFSRQFIKQKGGAVLAVSSHAGISGRVGGTAYAMAHGGMQALVKSAAREWGALNVRVNAILPPFLPESGMGRAASGEFAAAVQSRRALKSEPASVQSLARFAAEVLEQPGISGQILAADSRMVAR